MTDRGREFTVHLKRKAALKGKEEFRLELVSFEKSIYDIGNPDFMRSELQKLKSLADNAIQGFIDANVKFCQAIFITRKAASHKFLLQYSPRHV